MIVLRDGHNELEMHVQAQLEHLPGGIDPRSGQRRGTGRAGAGSPSGKAGVRVARPGHRPQELRLWTRLLDPKSAPAQEWIELYARRWEHELNYRELKRQLRKSEVWQSHTVERGAQEIAAVVLVGALLARARAGRLVTRRRRRPRHCPRAVRQPVSGWPRLRRDESRQAPCSSPPSDFE